jgi:ferric-dicitrate binding protein FerR (iron transport regulator)
MSPEACPMEHLVEAKHDGRLGARENASLDRHLAGCAPCRALEHTLADVRAHLRAATGDRVTPLEHQRGRLALLRAAAAPPPAQRPPLRVRHAAFAAAACVALAATSLLGAHSAATPATPATPALARRLPAAALRLPERTETTIQGSAEARFERRTDGPMERVALTEGKLALAVRKLSPGERFVVTTADAEVEVRGTVFEVEAHDSRLAGVTVSEGQVEVRHHGARALVAPGDAWQPAAVPDPVAAPSVTPAETPRVAPSVAPVATPPRRPATPTAAPAPGAPDDAASKKFAAAVAKLASGDYGEASRQLAEFRKANPADARAEDAAFLAIVSLQRAGKLTDAREAARRYLAAYPTGDRRAEAEKAAR